ncbi:carbohydrate ABC transporter permease [Lachnoclostridium sp. Marseille-P6806]|uniref:carbohydrate ABC transporter permease n=1 Tax=Lachnoclostridium sp. Marseille-P6806 TaxID=2364793 RepID=UPI001031C159|nr:carbohydrate ABC transporter permease [Lachnoclostridium sp. Marseille-P6806]
MAKKDTFTASKAVNAQTPTQRLGTAALSVVINALLALFSLSCIFPLVWMFYSSLKLKRQFNADIMGLPAEPSWANYIKVLSNKDYHIGASLVNSTRTTLLSLFFIILFGFIVGYILARIEFKMNRVLYVVFLMGMLIPVHSLLVPIYIVFNGFGLANRWFTLVIPYVAFGLPIAVFLVESYMKSIPVELEEAAAIDGSSFSKTLFSIILPVTRPMLITIAIIQTFSCWNEFSFALVLSSKNVALQTVPLAMTNFKGQFASDYPKIMTGMLITMAPIVVLYFAFSRQIIRGMVAGAVKG